MKLKPHHKPADTILSDRMPNKVTADLLLNANPAVDEQDDGHALKDSQSSQAYNSQPLAISQSCE